MGWTEKTKKGRPNDTGKLDKGKANRDTGKSLAVRRNGEWEVPRLNAAEETDRKYNHFRSWAVKKM